MRGEMCLLILFLSIYQSQSRNLKIFLMPQSFSSIVFNHLQSAGIEIDSATKNPIERAGRDVDTGRISWSDGVSQCRSGAKLYRLSGSQVRALESDLKRNFDK